MRLSSNTTSERTVSGDRGLRCFGKVPSVSQDCILGHGRKTAHASDTQGSFEVAESRTHGFTLQNALLWWQYMHAISAVSFEAV